MDRDREFGEFVDARALVMRRTAYLLCGDWHRAEDIVQNALIKLYVVWSRVRKDTADAYARKVLVRTAVDESRRGFFQRERTVDTVPELHITDDTADVDLKKALDALPPGQRAVVVLRYWEDLSITETAHLLGRTEGTVKSQAAKGLATLKELLEDEPQSTIRTDDVIKAGRRKLTRKRAGLAGALVVVLLATAGIVHLVQPRPKEVLNSVPEGLRPELTRYIKEHYVPPPGVTYEDVPELDAKAFQFYSAGGTEWAVARFRDGNGPGDIAIQLFGTTAREIDDCTPEDFRCEVRNGDVKIKVSHGKSHQIWVAEFIWKGEFHVFISSNNIGRFWVDGVPDLHADPQRAEPLLGPDELEKLSRLVHDSP